MDIQLYIQSLKENWWVIIAALLLCVGGAAAYSYSQTPVYEATTTFVASPDVTISNTGDLLYSLDTLASRTTLVSTYCEVLASQNIFEQAAASLGLRASDLRGESVDVETTVSCVVLPESSVMRLYVQGPSPKLTADLANAIGTYGVEYIRSLQGVYELRVLDTAIQQPKPVSPNHLLDIGFGAVVGLLGGAGIILLRQALMQGGRAADRPS